MGPDEQSREEGSERIILCDNGAEPDEGQCGKIAEGNQNPYTIISGRQIYEKQ